MSEPQSTILDYRNPHNARMCERVQQLIRDRDAGLRVKILVMLVMGIPLSFLAPLICTWIVENIQQRWSVVDPISGGTVFVIACLVIVPLLYLLEHRTRGNFFVEAARGFEIGENLNEHGMIHTASRGEWDMQTTRAVCAGYIEILLFAPRLTMDALRQRRFRRELGRFDVVRATDILRTLLATDQVVKIEALRRIGETRADFNRVLQLLNLHGWIGISKRGDRVWLNSDARELLRKHK